MRLRSRHKMGDGMPVPGASVGAGQGAGDAVVQRAARLVELVQRHSTNRLWCHWLARPLMCVALEGDVDLVEALVESGADTSDTSWINGDFSTALHVATMAGHPRVVQALVEGAAYTEIKDNKGATALHMAAERGFTAVVRALLGAGVAADGKMRGFKTICSRRRMRGDLHGEKTALHLACCHGYAAVVRELLKAGANMHSRIGGWAEEEEEDDEDSEDEDQDRYRYLDNAPLFVAAARQGTCGPASSFGGHSQWPCVSCAAAGWCRCPCGGLR